MENNVQIRNLTRSFGRFTLDDVSFAVPAGSIVGFVGENGAGKTTTIKLILNLIRRDGGEIQIFDKDNIACEKEIKEEVGVVFDACCFPDTATREEMDKILRHVYKSWDSEAYFGYCDQFQLPEREKIKKYSKGMKMKLSIAAALAHHPRLLILDEPTSGLDPVVRSEILDIFLEFIQEEDRSILFSSHITSDVEKIADYVVLLHGGKVVLNEQKDDLLYRWGVMRCGRDKYYEVDESMVVRQRDTHYGHDLLVTDREAMAAKYPDVVIDRPTIEEIMLFYADKKGA